MTPYEQAEDELFSKIIASGEALSKFDEDHEVIPKYLGVIAAMLRNYRAGEPTLRNVEALHDYLLGHMSAVMDDEIEQRAQEIREEELEAGRPNYGDDEN